MNRKILCIKSCSDMFNYLFRGKSGHCISSKEKNLNKVEEMLYIHIFFCYFPFSTDLNKPKSTKGANETIVSVYFVNLYQV